MIWIVLLVIGSVFTSTSSQRQDVICESDSGRCLATNLNSIEGELNFLTNTKTFRESITQIFVEDSILHKVPSEIFTAYENLNYLSMNQCKIKQIESNTFEHARNLKQLKLSKNQISYLNNSTFSGAENLEELWIGSNKIEELPSGIFTKLTKLKELYLFNNKIKNLDESIFSSLRQLTHLNLKGNSLRVISPNLFSQNTEIKKLMLGANQITDDIEFAIQNLKKLEVLDLADNKITKFENYPETVTQLYIRGNKLTKLFINKKVETLYAQSNKISAISAEPDCKIRNLHLSGNNLWSDEAIENFQTIESNPIKRINDLFLTNEVFRNLCLLNKELMASCRRLVMENVSRTEENINMIYENCIEEFLKVIKYY